MPIAHVCPGCGTDLSRLRAVPEPVYGFRLVRCPGCARHRVRREPPLRDLAKSFLRIDAALTAIAVQLACAALAIASCSMFASEIGPLLDRQAGPRFETHELAFAALVTVLIGVGTGAWLTAGFAHLPRARVFAAFLGVVLTVLVVEEVVRDPRYGRLVHSEAMPGRLLAILLLLPPMAAGVPVGIGVGALAARFRRWRFGWRRRRRRALQRG